MTLNETSDSFTPFGSIDASSVTFTGRRDLGHFDLALLGSSWDGRADALVGDDVSFDQALLLMPSDRGSTGSRDRNDAALVQFLQQAANHWRAIEYPSDALDVGWKYLLAELGSSLDHLKGGLRILVDISASARYLTLGFIYKVWRLGIASEIVAHYSDGRYPEGNEHIGSSFTRGTWSLRPIPGLPGEFYPGAPLLTILSLGFEGGKTMRAAIELDPDRLVIAVPVPPTVPEYAARSERILQGITEEFGVATEDILRAGASDALGLASRVHALLQSVRQGDWNVATMAVGTKAHSLGMLLAVMNHPYASLLYPESAGHREVVVQPTGKRHLVSLADMAIPQ